MDFIAHLISYTWKNTLSLSCMHNFGLLKERRKELSKKGNIDFRYFVNKFNSRHIFPFTFRFQWNSLKFLKNSKLTYGAEYSIVSSTFHRLMNWTRNIILRSLATKNMLCRIKLGKLNFTLKYNICEAIHFTDTPPSVHHNCLKFILYNYVH